VVEGLANLVELDPGGLDVFRASPAEFREILIRERHTLKRSLTDPHLLAGIGNAYSDEILHRARLSPVKMSDRLCDEEHQRLFEATRNVLEEWILRLRDEANGSFPEKVTAFRPEMAVHGKFRKPCPVCNTPVQRIVRAENEVNYCPVLPGLSDRRTGTRGSRALEVARQGLAPNDRRTRETATKGHKGLNTSFRRPVRLKVLQYFFRPTLPTARNASRNVSDGRADLLKVDRHRITRAEEAPSRNVPG